MSESLLSPLEPLNPWPALAQVVRVQRSAMGVTEAEIAAVMRAPNGRFMYRLIRCSSSDLAAGLPHLLFDPDFDRGLLRARQPSRVRTVRDMDFATRDEALAAAQGDDPPAHPGGWMNADQFRQETEEPTPPVRNLLAESLLTDGAVEGLADLDLIASWHQLGQDRGHRVPGIEEGYQQLTREMRRRELLTTGGSGPQLVLTTVPSVEARSPRHYVATPVLAGLAVLPFFMAWDVLTNGDRQVDALLIAILVFCCSLGLVAGWCAVRANFQGLRADAHGIVIDNLFARYRIPWDTIEDIQLVGEAASEAPESTKLQFLRRSQRPVVSAHPHDDQWPPSLEMGRHRALLCAMREAAAGPVPSPQQDM